MAGSYKIADGYISIHGQRDRAQIAREAREAGSEAGGHSARAADESSEREGRRLSRRGGLMRGLFTPNPQLLRALLHSWELPLSTPAGLLGAAFAAAFVAGVLGSIALAGLAALLVAGFAGAAVLILKNNERLEKSWEKFSSNVKASLERAAAPMVGTLERALGSAERIILRMEPVLNRIFKAIDPAVGALVVGILGGIEAFLIEIEPHIPALVDLTTALAAQIPNVMLAFADLFGLIAANKDVIIAALPAAIGVLSFVLGALTMTVLGLVYAFAGMLVIWDFLKDLFGSKIPAVWNAFTAWISGAWAGFLSWVQSTWRSIWQPVADFVGSIWAAIVGKVRSSTATVGSTIQTLQSIPGRVRAFFEGARASAADRINALLSIVRGVPGRIASALGNLSGLLRNAGRNVVQGLINGITSMFGALASKASSLAGIVRDHLPFSPAKIGPLSGQGSPEIAGRKIVSMVGSGITSERDRLSTAMAGALSGLAPASGRAPAVAGGATTIQSLSLNFPGFTGTLDRATAQRMAGVLHAAIEDHKRGSAR